MNNPQVEQFMRNIREKLPTYETVEKSAEVLKEEYSQIVSPLPDAVIAAIDTASERVKSQLQQVEILRPCSIIKARENWYTGSLATDIHWPAQESYLLEVKKWGQGAVTSIDATSSEIVSLLANPGHEEFRCRGLVVGYVQSGKTANMTAVIAKAVDAGYNLVVVLAGMTNKLRAQTQSRLEEDVVARHRERWQLYTTADDDGDFIVPRNGSFVIPTAGGAQLAVIKKVATRLNAFHKTILRTPPVVRRKLKVLIIDDECDQASVNSAPDHYQMTTINEAIRKIIKALPAVSYVGYTATPFANVFINPFPHNREELDDLYPEDFITSLPKPSSYFGPEEVFGCDPIDADNETEEEAGKNMIRLIAESELVNLVVGKATEKESFRPRMTKSSQDALHWFIGSCAIRLTRGHADKHMTMLVHTSQYVAQHVNMASTIRQYLDEMEPELLVSRVVEAIEEEYSLVPDEGLGHHRPDPAGLRAEILEVVRRLEVVIENGESDLRLDFSSGEPKIYVVVGGAVLARGLTLEGLSVSFFLRTSRQYDTLLQMGRWFGYRQGYEDLPRLWTTEDLAASFRALARIESEIREDIELYRERGVTPLDFAVRVRSIPGMAITSAAKMKYAYRTSISYEGRHVQTIRFDHRNDDIVAGNWKAASDLVEQVGVFHKASRGLLAKNVKAATVRRFLSNYSISDQHMDLRKELVLGFLDKHGAHWEWSVAIIQPQTGIESADALGGLGKVLTATRSRLRDLAKGHADVKALMSKADVLIDAEVVPQSEEGLGWNELKAYRPTNTPLLLIYPINAHSAPRKPSDVRVPLDAVGDLIGVGIVFPGELNRSGSYFAVELDAPTPEQLDEGENDWEEEAELINDPSS